MTEIDFVYRTMIAELGQRSLDAAFTSDFPTTGRFVPVKVKDKEYWYFDQPTGEGGTDKRTYVGRKDDPEITRRVEEFRNLKSDLKARRKLVSTLTREARLMPPERLSGDVVEALANAGLFRLRAVLIGTMAFQTYSGFLGYRLPSAAMQTGDADFAQDYAISTEVGDSIPPILPLLQSVDPTFRPVPHRSGSQKVTAFQNASRYRVELLTSNRGSEDYQDQPATMPALGGAAADPMRFLDFLLREPVRAILLHKSGISVIVPDPARYAVHKLIVATRRQNDDNGLQKSEKDIRQAELLIEALGDTRRASDVALAWVEAYRRGYQWQTAMAAGVRMMSPQGWKITERVLQMGGQEIGEDKMPWPKLNPASNE